MNRQEKYKELINAKEIIKTSKGTSTDFPVYKLANRMEVSNGVILCEKQLKRRNPNETSVIVVDFSVPTNVKIYKGIWNKSTTPNLIRTIEVFNGSLNNRYYYMYRDGFSRQELVLLPYLYLRTPGGAQKVRAWGNERTQQSAHLQTTPTKTNITTSNITHLANYIAQSASGTPQNQEVHYQINHIDRDKSTCDITKLELVTEEENRKHAVLVAVLHAWAEILGFSITYSFIGLSATNLSAIEQGARAEFCKSFNAKDKTYYINYLVEHNIIRPITLSA